MYAIILCGGSGTRLWPLSRKNFPKQFLKLYSDHSLLQETFLRVQKATPPAKIFLVTNEANYYNVFNQIKEIFPTVSKDQIIVEPASLNTAPAILLAVKYLLSEKGVKETESLVFLPADHYIAQPERFVATLKLAAAVGGHIGTIGITPTGPETGFGYIEKGESEGSYYAVKSFKEKPDRKTAMAYLDAGTYLWNSGTYIFNTQTFLRELQITAPALFAHFQKPYEQFIREFGQLTAEPIDTVLSEKSQQVIVFTGDFGWSDIGSFDALAQVNAEIKKSVPGKNIFINAENVYTYSDSGKMIAALGVKDLAVIESRDVIFVQQKGCSEEVKQLVEKLKNEGRPEVEHNALVYRPWGSYEVLNEAPNYKVKKITVFPGAALSLQSHKHRSEHWVVVKGEAKVRNGEKTLILRENESTYIPANSKHQLINAQTFPLEIIETQTGDYLGEDDITRYEDPYGRR